ncbi:MAG: SpoIID/LytB domain-containing protein, partial [Elusimicrobiota bacterium]|nr:SpoIID/LytB domain-containing protein [Elusimicrobiota bacterium]
ILIKRNKQQSLSVINEIYIENYCNGILPYEADTDWQLEALKVQAVVSRTYAMKNLGKHNSDGYDFCNNVCCEVYNGADGEKEISNKAVQETRGEVITYNGKLVNIFYHACCAGYTENPKYVWSWSIPVPDYLKGVECSFCKNSPHFSWTKTIDEKTIRNGLIKSGYSDIVKINSIELYGKTTSGRIKDIRIKYKSKKGKTKKIVLNAARFRLAVSPFLVKSTKIIAIKKLTKDTFEFSGNGWGHGVGLCQWGAKFMADKGYNYKQIINFYFPKTEIEKLY